MLFGVAFLVTYVVAQVEENNTTSESQGQIMGFSTMAIIAFSIAAVCVIAVLCGAWKLVGNQRKAKAQKEQMEAWEQKRAEMLRTRPTKRCCVRPVSIPVATLKATSGPPVEEEKVPAVEVTDIEVRMESMRSLPSVDFDAILVDQASLHLDDSAADVVSNSV